MGEGPEPAPAKAGVENQVGVVRERFFTPRLRVTSCEELNAWLLEVHPFRPDTGASRRARNKPRPCGRNRLSRD
jgi:hypothetical protein